MYAVIRRQMAPGMRVVFWRPVGGAFRREARRRAPHARVASTPSAPHSLLQRGVAVVPRADVPEVAHAGDVFALDAGLLDPVVRARRRPVRRVLRRSWPTPWRALPADDVFRRCHRRVDLRARSTWPQLTLPVGMIFVPLNGTFEDRLRIGEVGDPADVRADRRSLPWARRSTSRTSSTVRPG